MYGKELQSTPIVTRGDTGFNTSTLEMDHQQVDLQPVDYMFNYIWRSGLLHSFTHMPPVLSAERIDPRHWIIHPPHSRSRRPPRAGHGVGHGGSPSLVPRDPSPSTALRLMFQHHNLRCRRPPPITLLDFCYKMRPNLGTWRWMFYNNSKASAAMQIKVPHAAVNLWEAELFKDQPGRELTALQYSKFNHSLKTEVR